MAKGIPQEIIDDIAWVNTDESKIPMRVDSFQNAKSNNPKSWGSYKDAIANVNGGLYSHIGYVFHNNGLVGIDIDDCFNDDNVVSERAAEICNKFMPTYMEKSVSGKGVHIICKGNINFDGNNNGEGVEIYKNNRFFLITGKCFTSNQIVEKQEAIDWLIDKYFKHKQSVVKGGNGANNIKVNLEKISIRPHYDVIPCGCRNKKLLSIAGSLAEAGNDMNYIIREIEYINDNYCEQPLSEKELINILKYVERRK